MRGLVTFKEEIIKIPSAFANLHFFILLARNKNKHQRNFLSCFCFYVANYFMCLYTRASAFLMMHERGLKFVVALSLSSRGCNHKFFVINFHAMLLAVNAFWGGKEIYMKLFRRHGLAFLCKHIHFFVIFEKSPSLHI